MKKTLILILLLLIINFLYFGYIAYEKAKVEDSYTVSLEIKDDFDKGISDLRKKYNNDDVIAILKIDDTSIPVVQTSDNKYYLNHTYDKSYNRYGATFMDYRVNLDTSTKILIFSHSISSRDMPFEIITNYSDKSYFDEHKYIYLITEKEARSYEVFSVYVETNDFDYMNMDIRKDELLEHYQKLKNNSFYDTGVEISEQDDIIILQTCSESSEYKNYKVKYFLLIAKRIK